MEHFFKVSEHFFPLYLFDFHLKFVFLVKWEGTRGQGGGMEPPPLICIVNKNRRERLKGRISNEKQPLKCQSHKMIKHTQTIRRQQSMDCLNVFDHFVKLVLKGLKGDIKIEKFPLCPF